MTCWESAAHNKTRVDPRLAVWESFPYSLEIQECPSPQVNALARTIYTTSSVSARNIKRLAVLVSISLVVSLGMLGLLAWHLLV